MNSKRYVLVSVASGTYNDHTIIRTADTLERLLEYPASESTYVVYERKSLLVSRINSTFVEVSNDEG